MWKRNPTSRIIEEAIYGLDALRYAAQISAISLALLSPLNLLRQNVLAVYLGCIKIGHQLIPWLGSLEMLKEGLGLLPWIEGNLGLSTQISVSGAEAGLDLPNQFDV